MFFYFLILVCIVPCLLASEGPRFGRDATDNILSNVLIFSEEFGDKENCSSSPVGIGRRRKPCETKPFCNGIVLEPHWILTPAHCIGIRPIETLDVGYGAKDWREMFHYDIEYVVVEISFLSSFDSREDYGLIRLTHDLPIPQNNTPRHNHLKVPHRAYLQIIGFQIHTTGRVKREAVDLRMRNYECETAHEPTQEIDRLLCYQLKHAGIAQPQIDGAMIVRGNYPIYDLYGMHVKYFNLSSWYPIVGRSINVAGDLNIWLQAAKFERYPSFIPASKRIFCCPESTMARFRRGQVPYNDRNFAQIQNDGNPPFC